MFSVAQKSFLTALLLFPGCKSLSKVQDNFFFLGLNSLQEEMFMNLKSDFWMLYSLSLPSWMLYSQAPQLD